MSNRRQSIGVLLQVIFSLSLAGCAAAAVGAAGVVGGIEYTDRGAKGDVKGSVQQVNQQAKTALKEMHIHVTGNEMKGSGKEQDLSGKSGSTDISVSMTQAAADTTHVEVVARESTIKWNKDYAKQILAKIINQG
jgi:hypothetical protein